MINIDEIEASAIAENKLRSESTPDDNPGPFIDHVLALCAEVRRLRKLVDAAIPFAEAMCTLESLLWRDRASEWLKDANK